MIWLVLAVLLIAAPAQAQTVKWFTGFETGDLSEVTNTSCGAVSSPVASGAFAVECANGVTGRFVQSATGLGIGTTVAVRFRLDLRTWASGNGTQSLVQLLNAGQTHAFVIQVTTASKLAWGFDSNTVAIATGGTTVTTATYHLVEATCVVHASAGGCELKLDGNVEFTSFGTNTSALTSVDQGLFGVFLNVASAVDYDDVMICAGSGYCPVGRTIARQGVAGSPTYTTWTKTGTCSATGIETCWSATPFSTAAAATSAVANDAQTMNVHDFATTQTSHGTETIASHDIINACKTVMIAKTAVSSAVSIRRRLNGTDTDTAKTLGTADGYFDDGIWTTTTGILRDATKMEIGAVHGSGVNLDTVEDMGMHCDSLAVTVPVLKRVTQ